MAHKRKRPAGPRSHRETSSQNNTDQNSTRFLDPAFVGSEVTEVVAKIAPGCLPAWRQAIAKTIAGLDARVESGELVPGVVIWYPNIDGGVCFVTYLPAALVEALGFPPEEVQP